MSKNLVQRVEDRVIGRIGRTMVWRIARFVVGATPPLATLLFITHIILQIAGHDYEFAYVICSYSLTGFIAWIVISLAFQFDWTHRAFISYNYLVSFCVDFHREIGFGVWLGSARWLVLTIGLCLVCDYARNKYKKI